MPAIKTTKRVRVARRGMVAASSDTDTRLKMGTWLVTELPLVIYLAR